MSHNINVQSSGQSSYVGRKPAWHSLGTVKGQWFTWMEAESDGGLDFDVFKSQLHDGLGRLVDAWGVFRWDKKDQATNNKDAAVFLAAVGSDYKCIPHRNGFRLVDALMATKDGAHYETLGILGRGEVVWGLADLGLVAKVGDDVHKNYLLFATSHDGSTKTRFRLCDTRVVCQNTLTIGLAEQTSAQLEIRHSGDVASKVQRLHTTLQAIQGENLSIEQKLNVLASRKADKPTVIGLMDRLFPPTKDKDGKPKTDSTRRENIISEILNLYESNDGNAFPEQRGSLYNLLNATTNYVDHERSCKGSDSVNRAESALFGSGNLLKTQAFTYLLESAKDAATMESTSYRPLYNAAGQIHGPAVLDSILSEVS